MKALTLLPLRPVLLLDSFVYVVDAAISKDPARQFGPTPPVEVDQFVLRHGDSEDQRLQLYVYCGFVFVHSNVQMCVSKRLHLIVCLILSCICVHVCVCVCVCVCVFGVAGWMTMRRK